MVAVGAREAEKEWVAAFSTLRHDAVPPSLRFAFILMSLVNVSVHVVGNDAPLFNQRFSIDEDERCRAEHALSIITVGRNTEISRKFPGNLLVITGNDFWKMPSAGLESLALGKYRCVL